MSVINMIGQPCPIPVIEAKKALRKAAAGESIALLVDNDVARRNLEKMAAGSGHGFKYEDQDGNILVTITVGTARAEAGTEGLVVAVSRQSMGAGDEDLGKMLMKSFIHSLTELSTPPAHMLFFNGGIFLTTKGSTALDDLEDLERKGCIIASCGACLNYFGRVDELKVGSVTNMFTIAETMAQTGKLINM